MSLKIDMEKLAENLQKMGEDDLLVVVQMIHDNKSSESWTKNDVERKSHGAQLPRSWGTNGFCRRRVPSRPLYPARQSDSLPLGFHH